MRTWIFAVVVALVLAINLGLLSLRIAQTGEETVRERVAQASSALKGQLELIDARLSPRAVAASPDLIEATRPPVDPTQPLGKPDERALRAAAATLQPEPDLLIVASAQGAIASRRAKAAQTFDDASALPLVKQGLEGAPAATFAVLDGALYRVAAARIPGNAAVVVVGMLVDDRLAAQLRSQIDADVTLLQGGKPVASSLPADERARVARWAAAPAPGYGVLQVRMPAIGTALSGRLPRGATRYAVRGALVPLDAGVQAALTVPASPYLGWLARYQAFYLLALAAFVLLSFLLGLLWRDRPATAARAPPAPRPTPPPAVEAPGPQPSLDVGDALAADAAPAPRDVPWRAGEGPSGEHSTVPSAEAAAPAAGVADATAAALVEASLREAQVPSSSGEAPPPLDDLQPERTAVFAAPPAREPAKSEFSFAGLLEEPAGGSPGSNADAVAHAERAPAAAPHAHGKAAFDFEAGEATAPGRPSDELLAQSTPGYAGLEAEGKQDYFPGDEPTRIEPVSAALLDKLREKDEPEAEPLPESAIDFASGREMPPAEERAMPAAEAFAMPPAAPLLPLEGLEMPPPQPPLPLADAFIMPPPDGEILPADEAFAPAEESAAQAAGAGGAFDAYEAEAAAPHAAPGHGDAAHVHEAHAHEAPEADAHETHDTHAHEADAHEADAHDADAHETHAHEADAHDADAHETHAHEAGAHAADAHDADAAETHAHEAGAHAADAHDADAAETQAHAPAGPPQGAEAARGDEPPAEAAPEAAAGVTDTPDEPGADPDEPHWHETFERFRELREQLGEPGGGITFDRFSAKLRKNRADLMAKHNCRGVRFVVYEKDGKAAIKASAVR